MAQPVLVAAGPVHRDPSEVREVLLRRLHRIGVVVDRDVDDTVGHLHVERPDLGRLVGAEATTFDHRRAAHRDVRTGDADDDVATTENRGISGEAVSRRDADQRNQPAEPCEQVERERVESRDREPIGVARTSSTSFGEEDHGESPTFGQLEQAVLLLVAQEALRTGEHGVVVRHRHHGTTVQRTDAADEPVRRCALDQLLERATPALRGDDERPVLQERSFVEQVGDVLPCGPATRAVTPRDRVGAMIVPSALVAVEHCGEIRSRAHRVRHGRIVVCTDRRHRPSGGGERQQRLPLPHCRSDRHDHFLHDAAALGGDDVFHLHRLEDCDLLSWSHDIAGAHVDRDDRPLYRGRDDVRHRHVLAQRSGEHAERSTRSGAGVGHCAQGCGSSRRSWKSPSHCRSMSSVSMQSAKPA